MEQVLPCYVSSVVWPTVLFLPVILYFLLFCLKTFCCQRHFNKSKKRNGVIFFLSVSSICSFVLICALWFLLYKKFLYHCPTKVLRVLYPTPLFGGLMFTVEHILLRSFRNHPTKVLSSRFSSPNKRGYGHPEFPEHILFDFPYLVTSRRL